MLYRNKESVKARLRSIIARAIKKKNLELESSQTFKDLGADSLEVVQIMVAIEDIFGIELEDKDMQSICNVGDLIYYIEMKIAESDKVRF